ncbi:MAG TPA: DUF1573 domain-containing protein [Candidatus Tidjanibacter gallistercoris]|nr:DUF1573 domain-containing protein [Candidatus Tidjanibacter gallistercoris]
MYRIIIAAAIVLGITAPAAGQQSPVHIAAQTRQEQAPELTFDRQEHDFGTLHFRGEARTAAFTFTNTGSAPLVITRTEQSCTCLSVSYPRKPVMPGESGTLEITYTPKNETGPFNNNVKIYSNTGSGRPAVVFVRGEVVK